MKDSPWRGGFRPSFVGEPQAAIGDQPIAVGSRAIQDRSPAEQCFAPRLRACGCVGGGCVLGDMHPTHAHAHQSPGMFCPCAYECPGVRLGARASARISVLIRTSRCMCVYIYSLSLDAITYIAACSRVCSCMPPRALLHAIACVPACSYVFCCTPSRVVLYSVMYSAACHHGFCCVRSRLRLHVDGCLDACHPCIAVQRTGIWPLGFFCDDDHVMACNSTRGGMQLYPWWPDGRAVVPHTMACGNMRGGMQLYM